MPQPLAIARWDLSWLLHRDLRDGAFASLERVLDETQQRGFNALRLDPCPHLVATPENGIHLDRCELMPPGGRQVEVKIRNALQHLVQSTHERGMKVWFSSRFVNEVRPALPCRPEDFVSVWSDTLSLLSHRGYLDDVAGLDFRYQFPASGPRCRLAGIPAFSRAATPYALVGTGQSAPGSLSAGDSPGPACPVSFRARGHEHHGGTERAAASAGYQRTGFSGFQSVAG